MRDTATAMMRLAREGATRIFRVCLSLESGDSVAIFYDEATDGCAEVLQQAAGNLKLLVYPRFVPRSDQQRFAALNRLSADDQAAIDPSRGVLLCVSAGRDGLAYRKAVVKAAVDTQRYVGVVPGVTLPLLSEAVNIDYVQVQKRCEDLALAMLLGNQAVVTSFAPNGPSPDSAHQITMNLGGFRRSPITSTGIVPRGTWGNLPGGETFIAPIEQTANGTFALNGAFRGCVLRPSTAIVLEIRDGVVVRASGPSAEKDRLRTVLAPSPGTPREPLGLAELGVGVNIGIRELTGNALFDEKKAGTLHIALGDNIEYGGLLKSYLHEDLITVAPSLSIDGKAILENGQLVLDPEDWRETEDDARRLSSTLPEDFIIRRTPTHAAPDKSSRLRVRRGVGNNRQCSYTVGTDSVAADLSQLYALIPPNPEDIWFSLIILDWCKTRDVHTNEYVKGLAAILRKHELVTCLMDEGTGDGRD